MSDALPPSLYPNQFKKGGKLTDDVPPVYAFPAIFTIGSKCTSAPLVDSAQLKGHLALLHAFVGLRQRVDDFDGYVKQAIPLMPDDLERRWAWFVGLAVERFSSWCFNLEFYDIYEEPIEDILPPLDVLMVWHAYMLNPRRYAEDCDRLPSLAHLKVVGKVFAQSLPKLSRILISEPSDTRLRNWDLRTQRLFDPLDDAIRQVDKTIYCPTCRHLLQAPLMTTDGQGYLQQCFGVFCPQPSCKYQPIITRGVLGARKFAEDLVRNDGTISTYLAGTLRTPFSELNIDLAKLVKDSFFEMTRFARPNNSTEEQWIVSILKRARYRMDDVKQTMSRKIGKRITPRIISAYMDDRPFSVDLVGAVLRQGSFVRKIYDLLWTSPGFFESKEDEVVLQHAIARYHAFLDLTSSSPVSFFVPTLDIDLAWHTHQLMTHRYNEDCRTYVGRFVDHDDKVEENLLSSSFDVTCKAWQNRFGIRYAHCGCPLSGETIGQKLSRLISSYTRDSSYLVPLDRSDLLAATHPSDHSAVFAVHKQKSGERAQAARRRQFEKGRRREEQLIKEGTSDPRVAERTQAHGQAFLVPVPIYFVYGPTTVGCVTGTGSFVDELSGMGGGATCAVGAGGCGAGGAECVSRAGDSGW
ncbi:hypothetical protein BDZ94DRAFT_1258236 [Collybia nuda]|uniref:Uncharacterized protein n=1 Tax=Collybia nuda TaxID=64659 RepID=A0A9P5Y5G9_9AGAR|nr:hypothetical protein BDZ94DRAFT_1258236 [Collybia nuda]